MLNPIALLGIICCVLGGPLFARHPSTGSFVRLPQVFDLRKGPEPSGAPPERASLRERFLSMISSPAKRAEFESVLSCRYTVDRTNPNRAALRNCSVVGAGKTGSGLLAKFGAIQGGGGHNENQFYLVEKKRGDGGIAPIEVGSVFSGADIGLPPGQWMFASLDGTQLVRKTSNRVKEK